MGILFVNGYLIWISCISQLALLNVNQRKFLKKISKCKYLIYINVQILWVNIIGRGAILLRPQHPFDFSRLCDECARTMQKWLWMLPVFAIFV